MAIELVALFPGELGINGDGGNVTALVERAREHGVEVRVTNVGVGGSLPETADAVCIGSGPLSAVQAVLPAVQGFAERLRDWQRDGVVFVAIGGGWDALGREIELADGGRLQGAGVFGSTSKRGAEQLVDETAVRVDGVDGPVTGFANHDSRVALDADVRPFGRLVKGYANVGATAGSAEGARAGASIASNLHGPLLAMNPAVADAVLDAARAHAVTRGEQVAELTASTEWLREVDERAAGSRRALLGRIGVSA